MISLHLFFTIVHTGAIVYSNIRFVRRALIVSLAFVLSACGGGSSSGSSSVSNATSGVVSVTVPAPMTVSSGNPLSFVGHASSSAGGIASMYWQVDTLTLGANPVTAVGNSSCTATQADASGNGVSCTLNLTPPALLTADSTYQLTFFATDAKGNTNNSTTTLKVLQSASSTGNPVVTVGSNASVTSGDTVPLTCSATAGSTAPSGVTFSYQWVVNDAAGLTLNLLNSTTASSSFVAPIVTQATTVKLQCRVTDSNQKNGTAIQTVTINPIVLPTAVPISTSGGNVLPGATQQLDGTASKLYDVNGKVTTGTIYYLWKYTSANPSTTSPITVINPNNAVASIVFPTVVTTPTTYTFTLYVSSSVIDPTNLSTLKQYPVVFYVSALPPIVLTITSPIQQVNSGATVFITANTSGTSTNNGTLTLPPIYYTWVTGKVPVDPVLLNINSPTTQFIAPPFPAGTTPQSFFFTVCASYQTPVPCPGPGSATYNALVVVSP
ncbi:hypothetical protein ACO0K0_14290 [Undibacterium sp. SXout11W]|uniref:hypothetical protein n=1 Tax=Undibacterium sp. SXout11W TaxID=3413050 RepID=UPI003BEF9A64